MSTASFNFGFVVNPAPQPTGVVPPFPLSTSNPLWPAFWDWVTHNPSTANALMSGLQAWNADGQRNNTLRDWCVTKFRSLMSPIMTAWNAGQNVTYFSGDTYLLAGERLAELVVCRNWLADQLAAQEKSDFDMVAEQCVFNFWNWTQAKWGGVAYSWGGYATSAPLNNYFYRSFWRGTLYWAIHSQSPIWKQKILDLIPLIRSEYALNIGGGSYEGTGYGVHYWILFHNIWLTNYLTGIDLAEDCHVRDNLLYWCHCTTPDFKSLAPVWVQTRVSYPTIYDYHRALIVWAIVLSPNSVEAQYGRRWLTLAGSQGGSVLNSYSTCIDTPGPSASLPTQSYFAPGVGQMFAEGAAGELVTMHSGAWRENEPPTGMTAKLNDRGEPQLYLNGSWRMAEPLIWSNSGAQIDLFQHNVVWFKTSTGTTIYPQWHLREASNMQVADDGNLLTASTDLKTQAYPNTTITSYVRTLTFDRAARTLTIRDQFTTTNGTTGASRLTFLDQPIPQPDGSFIAGPLTIRQTLPGVTQMAPVDWKVESPTQFSKDCWRLEWSGAQAYQVEVTY